MDGLATAAFIGGGGIGWQELAVVLVVMLLVFGNRVPEIMRSLGKGLNQFKRGLHEAESEIKRELDSDPEPVDAGTVDAGTVDAEPVDAGPVDGGTDSSTDSSGEEPGA
ncbi:MAG: Sec-independent protein translocase subunit TatA/TatB [Planctomycetota bacterium]|jgi:sec-independent protein translocase protein TatA